jgi:MFS family permease
MGAGTAPPAGGLWRHADFLKLWTGQTVSLFGSLIGRFALPFVAIYTLNATPFQVAVIGAAGVAPGLLLGLLAGVWVDRLRRRPILIAADIGRALVLGSVPLAWVAGVLSIGQLIIVAALISALTICFDVAYRSYLPALIGRDELVEGNSKLAATDSVAEVAGFGLAGILVQVLGAPLAVLLDAFSFVGSAVSLALIRKPEPDAGRAATAGDAAPASAWREIAEGLALIRHEPTLRALVAAIAIDLFFIHIFVATLTLFLTRELALGPAIQGASFAIGGISAFAGALLAERVARRWGLGRALVGSFLIYRLATYFIPLAAGPPAAVVGLISFAQLLDAGATVQQISQTSLIQTITPDRLLGRFYASLQTIEKLAILLGLLLGGVLGQRIGLRPTLLIGITGSLLAIPFFLLAPAVRAGDVAAPAAEAGVVAD